jgi:hypothetical protein
LAAPGIKELLIVGRAKASLNDYLRSVESGLRRSKGSAGNILEKLNKLEAAVLEERIIADHDIRGLCEAVEGFGIILESESRDDLRVFAVMPKGIYDTAKLVDHAEDIFAERTLCALPEAIRNDVNLAGRCLAFELWTAMGFHAMRAVEAICREYQQVATRNPSLGTVPLGEIIAELEKRLEQEEGAKVSDSPLGLIIYTLLRLNTVYCLPVMDPRMTLTSETAIHVFELATDVITMICDDLASRSESVNLDDGIAAAACYMLGP